MSLDEWLASRCRRGGDFLTVVDRALYRTKVNDRSHVRAPNAERRSPTLGFYGSLLAQ